MEGCRLQSRSSAITLSAGFGGGAGGEKRAGPEAPGAAEAKTAIESSGGDLNRATSIVFQRRLSKLQQENEELSVMLNELSAAGTWAYVCMYIRMQCYSWVDGLCTRVIAPVSGLL